ncbi:MAG: dys-1 [Dehalococcoidia bacterium]|nr:dys-1 [Dehalococcoidia bacterium]
MSDHPLLETPVAPFEISYRDTTASLLDKMARMGFQARSLGQAAEIWSEMLGDKTTIFLAISGAVVPAGMRKILAFLISNRYVDCVVSTGAQLFHDLDECLGHDHYQTGHHIDDATLFRSNLVRMYDTLADMSSQNVTEQYIASFSSSIPRRSYSTREFLYRLGMEVSQKITEDGILTSAARARVPIYCPAIADSVLGFGVAKSILENGSGAHLDTIGDLIETVKIVDETEAASGRTGVIIIGGGVPRNFAQQAATGATLFGKAWFKMHKYGIHITTDSPQWGGLSGSTFEEAKSWGKYDLDESKTTTVYCDATIAFPLLASAVAERHHKTIRRRDRPRFRMGTGISLRFR